MSTVKSKKLQVGVDSTESNNFTIYQPSTPDGTLRIGYGNADSPTEVGQFNTNGYKPTTAPAFRAYMSTTLNISDGVYTKVPIDTIDFDTTGDFDTANNRFTPSVAGYYQVTYITRYKGGTQLDIVNILYKNGNTYEINEIWRGSETAAQTFTNTSLVYMNGTTDYIEVYGYLNITNGSGTPTFEYNSDISTCFFLGHLVHQA